MASTLEERLQRPTQIFEQVRTAMEHLPQQLNLGKSTAGNPIALTSHILAAALSDIYYADGVELVFGVFNSDTHSWLQMVVKDDRGKTVDAFILDFMPRAMPHGSPWTRPVLIQKSKDPQWFRLYKIAKLPNEKEQGLLRELPYKLRSPAWRKARRQLDHAIFRAICKTSPQGLVPQRQTIAV